MLETIDHGPVRELRLARPPANALDPALIAALRAAVDGAPASGARALVLSGRPGMFSAGLDVPHLLTRDRRAIAAAWEDFYGLMEKLATSSVPIAAAITGHSPAGGAVLAIFCDYRVMAEGDFRIGVNEVEVGIPMPPVIHAAMSRQVGARQAERLCVEAAMISPAEARAIGRVDELAPPERVVERALDWCRRLLALPPLAMGFTRRLARGDIACLFEEKRQLELDTLIEAWFSDETQSAMRALVARLAERRAAS
ncbi:MAG TPA: enoyl-CoA hydratase/isomerase family protein [Thermoanaerobaculia bacterium]|nr:enoyl-CoA hydratase/isomerase family protein [Thermoanaerobaculia bacterium]